MKVKSILPDVEMRQCASSRRVYDPVYSGENLQVNQEEFAMQVEGVGNFYARGGREVEFSVVPGADQDWVNLYLKGQIVVALLHQRRIITFHASSFVYNGRGIMILGESGAGKSSLTASFSLKGAGFLADDITPVIFRESKPHIRSLHEAIRIRRNTGVQLNIDKDKLSEAEAGTGKQYFKVNYTGVKDCMLHSILKVEIGKVQKPDFQELSPAEKFSLLRSEICMWEILAGMPETEAEYLHQLVKIVERVKFIRVVRPAEIEISLLHAAISNYLGLDRQKKQI
jgi:hypothetical protein